MELIVCEIQEVDIKMFFNFKYTKVGHIIYDIFLFSFIYPQFPDSSLSLLLPNVRIKLIYQIL